MGNHPIEIMIRHRVQQFLNLLPLVGVIVLQNTQNLISGGGDCSGRLTTAQLLLYEAKIDLRSDTEVNVMQQIRVPARRLLFEKLVGAVFSEKMASEPINVNEFQELARRALPKMYFDFYNGGAEDQHTLRENMEAFRRITFQPRVLVDVSRIDMSTTILGYPTSAPIMIAPIGLHKLAHAEGEVATSRAAAACNTIMAMSFSADCTVEEVYKRGDVTVVLVQRAERNGFKAIMLTVDTPRLGRMEADIKNKMIAPQPKNLEGLLSTEAVSDNGSKLVAFAAETLDPSLCWKDIDWLRSVASLPILVKGVLTAEDETFEMVPNGTSEIQQVEQTSKADSSRKAKEIAARNGITRPPLNFLAILKDANISIDMSSPDKLCEQLYSGVYLKPNKLKYFVDKKSNKNCFVLFARDLNISWNDNPQYWRWTTLKEASLACSGEEIEVAELLQVSWLDVRGQFNGAVDLSPGIVYEIVFVVRMIKYQDFSLKLAIILPNSKKLTRNESLNEKPLGSWFDIQLGEFKMSPENDGTMEFSREDHTELWKSGIIVKCAIIRPKEPE
ncbi:unnamed protein product [Camellia sinensis]